jgi:tetratricopeptide (TPR) repeat protein
MNRKVAAALLLTVSAIGCTHSKLAVRSLPVPESASTADEASLAKGRMLFARGEFALAADAFQKAARYDPKSADAYNGLAASYDQLGRYDLSRRYYELALAQSPEDGRVLRNFARSMLRQGDQLAARKLIAEAAALEHDGTSQAAGQAQPQPSAPAAPVQQAYADGASPSSVTMSIAPEPLPAAAPVTVANSPSLFQRVAATVIEAFPQSQSGVNVLLDAPAARVAPAPRAAPAPVPAQAVAPAIASSIPHLHIMNAVGRKRQAARMSSYLKQDGWATISTGDSRNKLMRSRILFGAADAAAARKLAATLPFQPRLQRMRNAPAMFLLLGRDALVFDNQLRAPKRS